MYGLLRDHADDNVVILELIFPERGAVFDLLPNAEQPHEFPCVGDGRHASSLQVFSGLIVVCCDFNVLVLVDPSYFKLLVRRCNLLAASDQGLRAPPSQEPKQARRTCLVG